MIQHTNISKEHEIENIAPYMVVGLPLNKKEVVNEQDVTCLFSIVRPPHPFIHIPLAVEYFESIDNEILEDVNFNGVSPYHVSFFKGKPFNIEDLRKKLSV